MFDLAPEPVDQRFDLKLKINPLFIEQIIAVDPVDRKAVALGLGLRHMHVQIDIRIVGRTAESGAADREMNEQAPVKLGLIADKAAFNRDADDIRQIHQRIMRIVKVQIELVPQQLFPETLT